MKRLSMLLELDRLGTITAVARALSYSTSGVSQQIGQLEREVGAKLVEPDGRNVRLTAAGHALVRAAPEVIDAWDRARAAVSAAGNEVAGPVRVAMFQTALLALGAELSQRLGAEHPLLELSIVQSEPEQAIPAVLSREIDLALIERYPGVHAPLPRGVAEFEIKEDPMRLAVPAAEPEDVSLVDLADRPWAMELRGSQAREWAEAQCRRAGFEPRVAFETADMVAQCDLVRAGAAVAFLPGLMPPAQTEGLRFLQGSTAHSRSLVLLTRSGAARHPAFAATRDAIAELLR